MATEPEELDESALFDQAVSDEPAEITTEAPEAEVEQPEKPEAEVVAETETTEPEKPVIDDNAPLVPSWRLREINEEKRRVAEENERLKAELAQRQTPQVTEAPKVEKAARPDPLLDPEGYAKAVRDELREEMLAERREDSLIRAREANQKEFDEAYAAARQAVDPALKARMQASRDPGKTLLEWHRENKTKAEIGNDLTAYKQRLREEALKDPEFRKTAMEAWRTDAQPAPQPNGRPRVELPPSLSSASRANAALKADNQDVSDNELFREIAG
jgi:hypothetical protein